MRCVNHDRPALGLCPTCGRWVCGLCLDELDSPRDYACPDCGGRGAALFDLDLEAPDNPPRE